MPEAKEYQAIGTDDDLQIGEIRRIKMSTKWFLAIPIIAVIALALTSDWCRSIFRPKPQPFSNGPVVSLAGKVVSTSNGPVFVPAGPKVPGLVNGTQLDVTQDGKSLGKMPVRVSDH